MDWKNLFEDTHVSHSVVRNSSILVIGSYIPSDEERNAIKDRLYYQIAAGVMFHTTPSET